MLINDKVYLVYLSAISDENITYIMNKKYILQNKKVLKQYIRKF